MVHYFCFNNYIAIVVILIFIIIWIQVLHNAPSKTLELFYYF